MFAPRLVLAAALSAALASPLMSGTAAAETTLRVGLAEDPDILDPTLARSYVGRIVFAAICDKLFDIDENLKIVPQLATSYEVSSDGKEYTFYLRAGTKWSDGEALDAAGLGIELHGLEAQGPRAPRAREGRARRRRRGGAQEDRGGGDEARPDVLQLPDELRERVALFLLVDAAAHLPREQRQPRDGEADHADEVEAAHFGGPCV